MKTIAYGSFFFNVMLFATYYAASKDALQRIDPVMFSGFELLVLLPVALGIVLITWKQLNKDIIKRGMLLGSCLGAVFFSLAVALKYTTATETAFFPCLNGIFAALFSWAVLRRRVSTWTWFAAALALIGMGVMIGSSLHLGEWRGDVGAFLGAMIYTGYIFLVDSLLVQHAEDAQEKVALWPVLGIQLSTLVIMAAVFIFLFGNWQGVHPQLPKDMWAVLWVGMTVLLPTILAPFMQKYVDPTTIAFIYILEPILSAVVAYFYLGEVLSLHSYIGEGLVLGGVLCQTVISTLPDRMSRSGGQFAPNQGTFQRQEPKRMGWKWLQRSVLVLAALVLVLFVLGSLGLSYTSLLVKPDVPSASATTSQVVGHVYFEGSGQINDASNQGINDKVQVDLHDIPAPAAGKSYYAWLLSDVNMSDVGAIFLGTLPVRHGDGHLFYPSGTDHTNLLAITSRFLVTEEDASVPPVQPSPDSSTWRYYAEIAQIPNAQDTIHHYSLLDHLRHLLVADPKLGALRLPGGLDIWLFRVTEKVLENATSARDQQRNQDAGAIRRSIIRILDYLDGGTYVNEDVPPGTPVLIDPRMAQVSLLEFHPQSQDPPGYLYHIASHLAGLLRSPGASGDQQRLAIQIHVALDNIRQWLEQVRQDAKELVTMTDDQLLQHAARSLLNDMVTQANDAYVGKLDPATNQLQAGVTQVHIYIQRLATIDVVPYQSGDQKFIAVINRILQGRFTLPPFESRL